MTTRIVALTLALVALALPASSLFAQESEQASMIDVDIPKAELEKVWEALSAHHHLPAKETLALVSKHPEMALVHIALDQDLFILHRRRALLSLADYWPDHRLTRAITLALLEGASSDPSMHGEAIYVLLETRGDEGSDHVKRLLTASSEEERARCELAYRALSRRKMLGEMPSSMATMCAID